MAEEVGSDLAAGSKAWVKAPIRVVASKSKVEISIGLDGNPSGNGFSVRLQRDGARPSDSKMGVRLRRCPKLRVKLATHLTPVAMVEATNRLRGDCEKTQV